MANGNGSNNGSGNYAESILKKTMPNQSGQGSSSPVQGSRGSYGGSTYGASGGGARGYGNQSTNSVPSSMTPSSYIKGQAKILPPASTQPPRPSAPPQQMTVRGAIGSVAGGVSGMTSSASKAGEHVMEGGSLDLSQSVLQSARRMEQLGTGTKAVSSVAKGVVALPGASVRAVKTAGHVASTAGHVAGKTVQITGKVVGAPIRAIGRTEAGQAIARTATAPVRAAAGAIDKKIVTPSRNAIDTAKKRATAKVKSTNEQIVKKALNLESTKEARRVINKTKGKTRQIAGKTRNAAAKGVSGVKFVARKGAAGTAIVAGGIKRGVHVAGAPVRGASKVVKVAAVPFASVGRVIGASDLSEGVAKESARIATKAVTAPNKAVKNAAKKNKAKIEKNKAKLEKLGKKGEKLAKKREKLNDRRKKAIKNKDKDLARKTKKKYDKLDKKGKKFDKKKGRLNKRNARRAKLGKFQKGLSWLTNPLGNLGKLVGSLLAKGMAAIIVHILPYAGAAFLIIMIITNLGSIVGAAGGAIAAIAANFTSSIMDAAEGALSLDWTPEARLLHSLEEMNWSQYIADKTCAVLGDSFVKTAKMDATTHFSASDNKIQTYSQLGDDGQPIYAYNWYCDVSLGTIANTWMREQCDRVTMKDGTVDQSFYKTSTIVNGAPNSELLYTDNGYLANISEEAYHFMPYDYDNAATDFSRINISPNANIVPIMSMAHYRYNDEWTWDNYQTVEAYVFYMYGLSHTTAHYDPQFESGDDESTDKGTYSYELRTPHSDQNLFTDWTWEDKWDGTNLNRPGAIAWVTYTDSEGHDLIDSDGSVMKGFGYEHSGCSNIYVHGYDWNSLFGDNMQAVANDLLEGARSVLSWVGGLFGADNLEDVLPMPDGVVKITYDRTHNASNDTFTINSMALSGGAHDGATYTSSTDVWNNALGDNITQPNGSTSFVTCTSIMTLRFSSTTSCGKEQHTPSTSCYTQNCSESNARCTHSHSTWFGDCYEWDGITEGFVRVCSHADGCPGPGCDSWDYGHTHGHTLTASDVASHPGTFSSNGCSWTLSCGKDVHVHKDWVDLGNPGCYDTVMFCKGHCGGHINPSINIAVTYTFEGLAYQDAVVLDASFMAATDFLGINFPTQKTVAKWNDHVAKTTAKWFRPFPNGPLSAIVWAGESYMEVRLKVVGWWSNFVHKLFGNDDEEYISDVDGSQYAGYDNSTGDEDEMGFEGWYELDNLEMLDDSIMNDLYSLYGTPETYYEEGVMTWQDFDVVFNVGMSQSLSPDMKENITYAIQTTYPDLSRARFDVIEDALNHVGSYNHIDSAVNPESHYNGMYSGMGASDSTGFVSGVLMRALGENCGWWNGVSDVFTSNTGATGPYHGSSPSKGIAGVGAIQNGEVSVIGSYGYKPGDVLLDSNGNAAIYLGTFSISDDDGNPFEPTRTWVVECSSEKKYSALRIVNNMSVYTYKFSPYQHFGIN